MKARDVSEETLLADKAKVKAFLSRPNLQCHFVKRNCAWAACMDTHKVMKREKPVVSYGRLDLRDSVVSMISEDIAEPAVRSEAFRYWLGFELSAYKRELEGKVVPKPATAAEEGMSLANFLMTDMSSFSNTPDESFGTSEKEYSIGDWCKASFNKQIEGVCLRVRPVTLTDAEVQTISIGISTLEEMYSEENIAKATRVKSINYGKGLLVKPGSKEAARTTDIPFEPLLVNVKPSAPEFMERLDSILDKPKTEQPAAITCLFHGAPGTSKTALGNHLAHHLGLPLLKKTYADIQDKYVGEGEKKLAAVFEEAQASNSILLIDEIDSLGSSRSGTDKDYVKVMTNQLLTSLDSYEGIIICTTNYASSLDPAVLRRFFLKMEFGFLSHDQQQLAMKRFFPNRFRGKVVPNIAFLTTGDFRTVKERSLYEPSVPNFERVLEMLREEVAIKIKATPELQNITKRSIGFH